MIISISGVGGTGKTSAAKLLAKKLKYKLIELNKLAKKSKAYIGYDKKRKSYIVSVYKLKKEVKKLNKKYPNIILDGLIAHEFPSDFVIVLRCKPKVLEKRLKKKYKWPTKITENLEAETINLIGEEAMEYNENVYEIDTTNKTVRQTVKIIEKILAGKGEKYRAGKIDWLN